MRGMLSDQTCVSKARPALQSTFFLFFHTTTCILLPCTYLNICYSVIRDRTSIGTAEQYSSFEKSFYLFLAPQGTGPASLPFSPTRTRRTPPWGPHLRCACHSPRLGTWQTPAGQDNETESDRHGISQTWEFTSLLFKYGEVLAQVSLAFVQPPSCPAVTA